VGTPNRCHVSASKSGLEGLMRARAVELAPHSHHLHALSRAPSIPRALLRRDRRAEPHEPPDPVEAFRARSTRSRHGAPAGRAEGTFITGQTIHVNGGEFLT